MAVEVGAGAAEMADDRLEVAAPPSRSVMILLQAAVSGLLLGAVYALFSSGLTLIWGMMNFINFAPAITGRRSSAGMLERRTK